MYCGRAKRAETIGPRGKDSQLTQDYSGKLMGFDDSAFICMLAAGNCLISSQMHFLHKYLQFI